MLMSRPPDQSRRHDRLFDVYSNLYPALRDQFARLKDAMHELV